MLSLATLSKVLNAPLQGTDHAFTQVSTDTRTLQPGDLFIALQGPNFNANDYVAEAAKKGAIAAIVSEPVNTAISVLQVPDTRIALGQIAAYYRQQFHIQVIGLTGSVGKTTTKTMLASILEQCGPTLATEGTLNNDFGVPKTLLRLTPQHQYAVIEMGANHHGEIDYVTRITRPTVAFITTIGPVHLEGFGNLADVAKAKSEIYAGLTKDGKILINNDDSFADFLREKVGEHVVTTFASNNVADIKASQLQLDAAGYPQFNLTTPKGSINIHLKIMGEHNVINAVAAAAAAFVVGASLTAIKAGLEAANPVYRRLVIHTHNKGTTIIDDSYNANPLAVTAAIQLLAQKSGEKILALGEMRELGSDAIQYHADMGRVAKELGITRLYTYGDLTEHTAKSFGEEGFHFPDQAGLIAAIRKELRPGATILVKGSLSTHMNKVVAALMEG